MVKAKLTKKEVKHVAQLAQLKLTEKEIGKFRQQLSEILAYIEKLDKLNTRKIKPTSQITGLENVFRKDQPAASLSQAEVLSNAPDKEKGFFKIKAVFEEI